MAYIPLDEDTKVKGKAAIDVVCNPLGKSGGALIQQFMILTFGSLAIDVKLLLVICRENRNLRKCHLLSEIKMEHIGSKNGGNSESLVDFGVYPQLKSLYLGRNSWLNDERIIMFASIFPNLQLLDLTSSENISEGICEVLRRCCKIKHLNLSGCYKVKLHSINFVVPKLEVLDLSGTTVDDETLHVISEKCSGLLQIILGRYVTEKGVKHMVEKCKQLREINLGDLHLSDKKRKFFSRRGCLLC